MLFSLNPLTIVPFTKWVYDNLGIPGLIMSFIQVSLMGVGAWKLSSYILVKLDEIEKEVNDNL